jgi:hypothetical protein
MGPGRSPKSMRRARAALMLYGWTADMQLAEQAALFDIRRFEGRILGVTDQLAAWASPRP